MIQLLRRTLGIAAATQFCAIGLAYQVGADGPLDVRTRAPRVVAPEVQGNAVMRVNSSLVLIPVHVTSADGSTVTSLRKDEFALFQDGVKQTITHFSQDDAPISAGVLLDISSSMKNKIGKASEAATEFFKFANPEDEFFLVEFNGRAKLKVPFTRDWSSISDEIAHARTSGMTAMLDGIHLAVAQMKRARNPRKALIVLSDGGDNFSRRGMRELKAALLESDVQVFAMGVFDEDYAKKHAVEERNGPKLLDQVAQDTGGRDFPVVSLDNLPNIGVEIARELRNEYLLGFSPEAEAADGKFHRVNLQLLPQDARTDLRAYYRTGYYAPGQ